MTPADAASRSSAGARRGHFAGAALGVRAEVVALEWASRFFGRRCARLSFTGGSGAVSALALAPFDIVEAKIAAGDSDVAERLAELGFRFCEGETAFFWTVDSGTKSGGCVRATAADVAQVRDIAGKSFPLSRFRPPWYSVQERNSFYRQWAENAVSGVHDDECLVLRQGQEIEGFVTLRDLGAGVARVGLLAVAPGLTGRGVGGRLLGAAHAWCAGRGADRLTVATQTGNVGATRFYQAHGAAIGAVSRWMYR